MSPFDTTGQKRTNWQPKRHFAQNAPMGHCNIPKPKREEPKTLWGKIKDLFRVTK